MSLLTEQEIRDIANSVKEIGENSDRALILAAQKAVIKKIKAQGPAAYWDGCYSDPYFRADYDAPGIGKGGIPLYKLPEGD